MDYQPNLFEQVCLACYRSTPLTPIVLATIDAELRDESLLNTCVVQGMIYLLVQGGQIVVCSTPKGDAIGARVKRLMKCEVDDG